MFALLGPRTRRLALPVLAFKCGLVLFVVLARLLLPPMFHVAGWSENTRAPGDNVVGLASAFSTWDAAHYLTLAERGYAAGSVSNAYYPLWPALVGVAGRLAGGAFLPAAILLALLLGWAGTLAFHAWVTRRSGPDQADAAVLLLLAWPGSLFTVFPYSESLFLLLAALFLLGLESGATRLAAVAAFLLPLTRAVGLFVALPGAIHFLRRREWRKAALFGLLPVVGWGVYLAILGASTGNPFAGFDAQGNFVSTPSLGRLVDPGWWAQLATTPLRPHGFLDSIFDRGAFLLVLATVVPMLIAREWVLAAFVLPFSVIPAVTVGFMSFLRYAAVLLPSFDVAAGAFSGGKREAWRPVVAGWLLFLQLIFLLRHANFFWAS